MGNDDQSFFYGTVAALIEHCERNGTSTLNFLSRNYGYSATFLELTDKLFLCFYTNPFFTCKRREQVSILCQVQSGASNDKTTCSKFPYLDIKATVLYLKSSLLFFVLIYTLILSCINGSVLTAISKVTDSCCQIRTNYNKGKLDMSMSLLKMVKSDQICKCMLKKNHR